MNEWEQACDDASRLICDLHPETFEGMNLLNRVHDRVCEAWLMEIH